VSMGMLDVIQRFLRVDQPQPPRPGSERTPLGRIPNLDRSAGVHDLSGSAEIAPGRVVRPETLIESDRRDRVSGYTGPTPGPGDLHYGPTSAPSRGDSAEPGAGTPRAPIDSDERGSVPAGWQSGSDGRIRR